MHRKIKLHRLGFKTTGFLIRRVVRIGPPLPRSLQGEADEALRDRTRFVAIANPPSIAIKLLSSDIIVFDAGIG